MHQNFVKVKKKSYLKFYPKNDKRLSQAENRKAHSLRRKSLRQKSLCRKSLRRQSLRQKSLCRKSLCRKSLRRKSKVDQKISGRSICHF
jgi:hypothetical protein